MSRIKSLFALLLCAVLLCSPSLAHSGRTDSKGGHRVTATGEYHYHHGYPAHQHTGGVCPYNFDDKTGQSSGTKGSGTSKKSSTTYIVSTTKEDEDDDFPLVLEIFILLFLVLPVAASILASLFEIACEIVGAVRKFLAKVRKK